MATVPPSCPSSGDPDGGIPGLLGEFYDSDQEKIEETNGFVRDRSLYVKVDKSPFKGKSENEIALGIEASNDPASLPEFLNLFIRKGTLFAKLTFESKKLRDSIYAKKDFKFDGNLVNLELPSDGGLTIYMHGIPLQASHGFVATWLQSNFQLQLVEGTEIRFCSVPGCTKIKSTARSAVVKVPPGRTVPGFALMRSKLGEVVKIRIRYDHCGLWCRKCFGQGHKLNQCKIGSWVKAPNLEIPAKQKFPPPASPTFSPTKPCLAFRPSKGDGTDPDLTVEDWAKEQEAATRPTPSFNDGFPKGMLDKEYPNKMTGFSRPSDVFSNKYPAKFTILGQEFCSSEHYFFAKKAEHLQDSVAAAEIEKVRSDPIAIAKIGNKLKVSDNDYSAKAWRWLWDGNCAKYEQNPALLIQLFKTNSTRLVLCTKDKFWGCGIDLNSELWRYRENWIGLNVFGDLLTHLRRQLMTEPKFKSEIASVMGKKRKPTTPVGNNKLSRKDDSEDHSDNDSDDSNLV